MKAFVFGVATILLASPSAWAVSPEQRELALRVWQSQNLAIIVAESLAPGMSPYPASSDHEIARRYSSMLSALKTAIAERKCFVKKTSSPENPERPEEGFETKFLISGNECPIDYKNISNRKGMGLRYQVNDPAFQDLNDAVGEQFALLRGSAPSMGEFHSKTLGKLPFTLSQSLSPGDDGTEVSSVQTVSFPGFTAELKMVLILHRDGSLSDSGFFLNGEPLSDEEIATYVRVYPLLMN